MQDSPEIATSKSLEDGTSPRQFSSQSRSPRLPAGQTTTLDSPPLSVFGVPTWGDSPPTSPSKVTHPFRTKGVPESVPHLHPLEHASGRESILHSCKGDQRVWVQSPITERSVSLLMNDTGCQTTYPKGVRFDY